MHLPSNRTALIVDTNGLAVDEATHEQDTMTHSLIPDTAVADADQGLLPGIVAAVHAAGAPLLDGFVTATELLTVESIAAAIRAADTQSLSVLRPMLERARPSAGWVEDELEDGVLPPGE